MSAIFTRPDGRTSPSTPNEQPRLEAGQARRWMTALPRESSAEAIKRAKATMKWGKSIVHRPTSARGLWLFTVRVA